MVSRDNLKHLFRTILDEDIFIEDDRLFILFLTTVLQAGNQANTAYNEQLQAFLPAHHSTAHTSADEKCRWALELGE